MKARRSAFEKAFRNVWATGDTGVSWMQLTVDSRHDGEAIIAKLFNDTLIADVQDINHVYQRVYTQDGGKMEFDKDMHKLIMLTSDDRVAEAIESVGEYYETNKNTVHQYPKFDLIVTPLATGSKEYIEWVKLQTLKKDSKDLAYYNEKPSEAIESYSTMSHTVTH